MNVLHITIGENNTAKYLQIRKIIRNTMTAPCWWWTRNFGHIKTIAHSRRLWWFTQTHHAQIEWVSVIDRIKNAVELHPGSNYRVMHERWITSQHLVVSSAWNLRTTAKMYMVLYSTHKWYTCKSIRLIFNDETKKKYSSTVS